MLRWLCWIGYHDWGTAHVLETQGITFAQCERCGQIEQDGEFSKAALAQWSKHDAEEY